MNRINEKTTIQFPDAFFKEEVRCGFTVTSHRKKVWAIELDLLNQLLKVCDKHDIKVCAFSGTLLGAVRHEGFIPWDDDLDMCLTRPEYEKLLAVAPYEFKGQYFLQNAFSDRHYFCGYSRLRNSLTTGIITGQASLEYNNGIYIDVYVLDGLIDDAELLAIQLKKRKWSEYLAGLYCKGYQSTNSVKKLCRKIMRSTYCKIVPYERAIKRYDSILSQYTPHTNKLALMTHADFEIKKYWIYKEDLENLMKVPFEGIQIPIPGNYDRTLKNMYGNYRDFPPVESRGEWHTNMIEFDPDESYVDVLRKNEK